MPEYNNSRWRRCPDCHYAWPHDLPGSWAVRGDGLLEGVLVCPCGKTALLLRARLMTQRTIDLDMARRLLHLTDMEIETLADNLLDVCSRVEAHLPVSKRRIHRGVADDRLADGVSAQ